MLNKKILFFVVSLGILFFAGLLVGNIPEPVKAADTSSVAGFAWSDNVGWIDMAPVLGGVQIDSITGAFSGYAWSDNVGWIDFAPAPAPASGFPSAPLSGAKVDWLTGQVSGWAKAVAGSVAGWDGWISMRGANPNYGVSIDKTTGNFSGYAWGSDVIGWIDFSKVATSVTSTVVLATTTPTFSISLSASPSQGNIPLNTTLTAVVSGTATGMITYKFDCLNDGIYEGIFSNISEETKTYSCSYGKEGGYTARVYAERAGLSSQATIAIAAGTEGGMPVVSITANPGEIDYNTSSTITWSAINADTCTASSEPLGAWSGAKDPVTGSESTGNLTASKKYTLTCTGPKGTALPKSVSVSVRPAPRPTCTLTAEPSSGQLPLEVKLTATASGGSGEGYKYKFDCENDLNWETPDYSSSENFNCIYTTSFASGVAKAGVIDSYGTTAECKTPITILGSLSVSLEVKSEPTPAPMTVELEAIVSGTEQGTINYKFDCDNDGTYESPDPDPKYINTPDISKSYNCTYQNETLITKIYTARVRVERGTAEPAENTVEINVGPKEPFFILDSLPSSALQATIFEGKLVKESSATTIKVTDINNFSENVALTSNVNEILGATGNFSKQTLTSDDYKNGVGSVFKIIDLPGATKPGVYIITITGTSESNKYSKDVTLNIESVSTSEIWEF